MTSNKWVWSDSHVTHPATYLSGSVSEEPGGNSLLYFRNTLPTGYNIKLVSIHDTEQLFANVLSSKEEEIIPYYDGA